jgi:hypothetical protein
MHFRVKMLLLKNGQKNPLLYRVFYLHSEVLIVKLILVTLIKYSTGLMYTVQYLYEDAESDRMYL